MAESGVRRRTLNFVVAGAVRSGAGALQAALDARDGVLCHGGLLARTDADRQAAHVRSFGGPSHVHDEPCWCPIEGGNPCRYLTTNVFDNPTGGEKAVGVHVPYHVLRKHDLWDYLGERVREGDFCVVHVVRNPLACLASLAQARRTGMWASATAPEKYRPAPVRLEPAKATAFVRDHLASQGRLLRAAADQLSIAYSELVYDYSGTVNRALDFLEVPEAIRLAHPQATVRLPNPRCALGRIANVGELRSLRIPEVDECLDDPEFL